MLVTALELELGPEAPRLLCLGVCRTRNVDKNRAQSLREQRLGSVKSKRNLQPFFWWFSRGISIEGKRNFGLFGGYLDHSR